MKKIFLLIVIIAILSLLCQILPGWVKFEYFTNNKIDPNYLNIINLTVRQLIFAVPFLGLILAIDLYLFIKLKRLFTYAIVFMHTPYKFIAQGFILLKHTDNYLYPEIATFSWKDSNEYSSYLLSNFNSITLSYYLLFFIYSSILLFIQWKREGSLFFKDFKN